MKRTLEVARVRHSVVARRRASRLGVRRARPVTAHGDVEDEVLRQEVAHDVALRVREVRVGRAPARGVRLLARDVGGDRVAREEPDRDAVRLERVREDAAGLHVEAVPEGRVLRLLVRAPGVVAVRGRAGRAEHVRERVHGLVERAPRAGVQRDLVLRVGVHALCDSRARQPICVHERTEMKGSSMPRS